MLYSEVNGQQVTQINITDRAFAYGDGLFTTAKVEHGKVVFINEHLQRLLKGCEQLKLPQPDIKAIKIKITKLALIYPEAVLKVVVTAGQGGRGYSRQGTGELTVVISLFQFPNHYHQWQQQGIILGISKQRLGINPMLSGIKHLNRLEQVLIRAELDERREDDLVVLNINEQVIETSCANIYWLKQGVLYTTDLAYSGVDGIMRQHLLKVYPQTKIVKANIDSITSADNIFICNTVMGIVPVREFNGNTLPINTLGDVFK